VAHPQHIADRSAGPFMARIGAWGHVPHRDQPDNSIELVADWFAASSGAHG
jgi:hypothetical protein